jgi:hypothetical protein
MLTSSKSLKKFYGFFSTLGTATPLLSSEGLGCLSGFGSGLSFDSFLSSRLRF